MFDDATGVNPVFDTSGYSAGALLLIALRVSDSTGNTDTVATTVTVQAVPSELVFTSTGDPTNIGDRKTISSSIDISGTDATIAYLTIQINLTHKRASDLTATLSNHSRFSVAIPGPILARDYGHECVILAAVGQTLDDT